MYPFQCRCRYQGTSMFSPLLTADWKKECSVLGVLLEPDFVGDFLNKAAAWWSRRSCRTPGRRWQGIVKSFVTSQKGPPRHGTQHTKQNTLEKHWKIFPFSDLTKVNVHLITQLCGSGSRWMYAKDSNPWQPTKSMTRSVMPSKFQLLALRTRPLCLSRCMDYTRIRRTHVLRWSLAKLNMGRDDALMGNITREA